MNSPVYSKKGLYLSSNSSHPDAGIYSIDLDQKDAALVQVLNHRDDVPVFISEKSVVVIRDSAELFLIDRETGEGKHLPSWEGDPRPLYYLEFSSIQDHRLIFSRWSEGFHDGDPYRWANFVELDLRTYQVRISRWEHVDYLVFKPTSIFPSSSSFRWSADEALIAERSHRSPDATNFKLEVNQQVVFDQVEWSRRFQEETLQMECGPGGMAVALAQSKRLIYLHRASGFKAYSYCFNDSEFDLEQRDLNWSPIHLGEVLILNCKKFTFVFKPETVGLN